jgi:hypothetical protein
MIGSTHGTAGCTTEQVPRPAQLGRAPAPVFRCAQAAVIYEYPTSKPHQTTPAPRRMTTIALAQAGVGSERFSLHGTPMMGAAPPPSVSRGGPLPVSETSYCPPESVLPNPSSGGGRVCITVDVRAVQFERVPPCMAAPPILCLYFVSRSVVLSRALLIRTCARMALCKSLLSWVQSPFLKLPLRLPRGPPEPLAPPCIRHLALPFTAACLHGCPARVRAPHRRWGCAAIRLSSAGNSKILFLQPNILSETCAESIIGARAFFRVKEHPCV